MTVQAHGAPVREEVRRKIDTGEVKKNMFGKEKPVKKTIAEVKVPVSLSTTSTSPSSEPTWMRQSPR